MLHVPISMLVYWRVTISNHRKWGFFHRFNLIWAINYYLRLVFLLVAPQDELCGWITCEKSHSWTPHTQASKMLIFNQTWRKSEAQISFVSRIFPLNILKCPVFFLISHGRGEMSEAWRDRSACICTRARISESRSVSQRPSPKWQWFVYGYFYGVIIPWMEWLPDLYLVFRATTVVRVATNTV